MRPLAEFAATDRAAVKVLLSDIDDTMTRDGRLPAATLAAMERLAEAGVRIVPVTGRPAGWCDHIARMWPVDAVVGENGAFWFAYDRGARRMRSHFAKPAGERAEDRARLTNLGERILAEVPGTALASDQFCRAADLAIDFCEDVVPLDALAVARIVAAFERAGATAKVSSIHVNGWFGSYDKRSMAAHCLGEVFGLDLGAENAACVYAGDSPNDAPMFAAFQHGVGVANVRDFEMPAWPAWVTQGRAADGFVELVDALLEAR
ncbi:MAG: HAD-IIB family hydrolase [Pseudomonadota bacterium]